MMKFVLPSLPIRNALPRLRKSLILHRSAVLAAEPGSGKTTVVPLALLEEPWLAGKKVIMLEPRRLAARMAARRMSELAGDEVGGLVGYRIRFEQKISSRTRVEVVTEGVLTRMMQHDPSLSGVGLVVFDEFHERTLTADLALALCLEVQELREDLKILIMSATMDTARVSALLGSVPVITGECRCFPVSVTYLPRQDMKSMEVRTVTAIHRVLADHGGDVLVFLPGAGEIIAVQQQIAADVLCLPLYGNLPQEKQDLVFNPAARRRLILATPIAETSLTIEGVSVVVDAGLMKVPRFSPTTGLTSLDTVPISKASADQRAGRAGRLGPGTCYRLWTEGEHHSKADFFPPEINNADLAPLFLEVLQWGVADPRTLKWLDPPREGALNQARELLVELGVVDDHGRLTAVGREIGALPLHPRLALMLIQAREQGHGPLACRLAAMLQNRDPFRGRSEERSVDVEDRLQVLRMFEQKGESVVRARGADPNLCRRILQEASQYGRLLGVNGPIRNFQESGNLLAFAYPDRIAQKKHGSAQHLLASGRGVLLPPHDHLHKADLLVAAHVDGSKKQGRIYLAAALSRQEIIEQHGHLLTREERITWSKNQVEAVAVLQLGNLELSREPLAVVDPERLKKCLLEGIQQCGISCLSWDKQSRELQARMQSAHLCDPDLWPDVSDDMLGSTLSWLSPYLDSMTTLKQVQKIDLRQTLLALLSWQKQQELDRLFPTHLQVPSGSRIRLLYQPGEPPVLAVRLQEMFGASTTPTVCGGRVAVLVHLLSPAGRPIQVTRDLAGFWRSTYYEVKKELKGRYPKHYWPEDPFAAEATSRVRPRK